MRQILLFAGVVYLAIFAGAGQGRAVADRLSDQEFWKIVTDSSEPGGYFRSADITNLTSNETQYEYVLADLVNRTKPGGVYLGVGPEQNYTYIAALKRSEERRVGKE